MFSSSVFMGPLYFMRLKHLTEDKMNARPSGRKEQRTHQPTGGRGNEGGMRIGEMERDTLIAHGVTSFLQESMMKRSDGTSFVVCNGCGTIPIYNTAHKLYVCPMCDGPLEFQGETADNLGLILPVKKSRATFSQIAIPYALKLLDQELTTFMNGGLRFLTEQGARKFREPTEMNLDDMLEALKDKEQSDENIFAALSKKRVEDAQKLLADMPGEEEDEAADREEEGAPAENETGSPPPAGTPVIEFYSKIDAFKELSNMYPVNITLDGKVWPSVEHYFHAMKFPDNEEYQETIRKAKDGKRAKKLGKTKEVPIREDWKSHRDEVMRKAVTEKFSLNHPELRAKLLETGNAILREANPKDNYWGIGKHGTGKNRLGEILMEVREAIRAENLSSAASNASSASSASSNNGSQVASVDELMTRTGVAEAEAEAAAASAEATPQSGGAAPVQGTTVVIQQPGAVPQQQVSAQAPAQEFKEVTFGPPPPQTMNPVQPAPSAPAQQVPIPPAGTPPVLNILEVNAAPANSVQQPMTQINAAVPQVIGMQPIQPVATQVQVGGAPDPDVKVVSVSHMPTPSKK